METFKMTMQVEDFEGKTGFFKEYEGDSPNVYEFANFCYAAGIAYGFLPSSLDKVIQVSDEI